MRTSEGMAKAPHRCRPDLVEKRQIAPHEFEDFGRVGTLWTRALDVDLAAKLVGQRPPHSIDDKPALHPEDYVPEEGYSARRTDVALYPSSGGRVCF